MRRLMVPFCAVALILAGTSAGSANDKSAAAKETKEVQQDTKTITNNGTTKTSTDTIYGKVESYDPGKSIKVTIPGKIVSTKSFDLNTKDWTYHVARNLKAGQFVEVIEKTDNAGHKTLSVQPSSKGYSSRTESPR